jgi:hypothetical protein
LRSRAPTRAAGAQGESGRVRPAPVGSIVPLSGVTGELVLAFAWEITWYQYRVMLEG